MVKGILPKKRYLKIPKRKVSLSSVSMFFSSVSASFNLSSVPALKPQRRFPASALLSSGAIFLSSVSASFSKETSRKKPLGNLKEETIKKPFFLLFIFFLWKIKDDGLGRLRMMD